jgi:uncharacterized membrane protein YbhN (UPF0104 family)
MRISRSTLCLSAALLAAVAVAAAAPQLLRSHVTAAFDSLSDANRAWLVLAALGFAGAFAFGVGAWRAAFAAAGARIGFRDAGARIGLGCLVNAVAPAKLGDAVKVALCARAIDAPGRLWTAGGVYAALAAARSVALATLVVCGAAVGALPLWPVFALGGVVAAVAVAAHLSPRLRRHPHIRQLLDGAAALERSPRATAIVLGWSAAMVIARLAATVAVAAALGLPHPAAAALVILPALDLAGALPLTPGSVGIGSGAVAVALAARGIGMGEALGVGIAMQALETIVSVVAGSAGALYLARPGGLARVWAARAAVVGFAGALAAVLGVALLNAV